MIPARFTKPQSFTKLFTILYQVVRLVGFVSALRSRQFSDERRHHATVKWFASRPERLVDRRLSQPIRCRSTRFYAQSGNGIWRDFEFSSGAPTFFLDYEPRSDRASSGNGRKVLYQARRCPSVQACSWQWPGHQRGRILAATKTTQPTRIPQTAGSVLRSVDG